VLLLLELAFSAVLASAVISVVGGVRFCLFSNLHAASDDGQAPYWLAHPPNG
jgi:hypothetical protein